MYGCESWPMKKAEHWRIDAFELQCWRRLLRVPWTARRSNHSILKGINPEYLLEGLMLKVKLQYFGHLICRTDAFENTWCWERLKVGGEGDDGRWDGWMASLSRWTWVWVNSGSCWWAGRRPDVPQSMGSQTVGHDWMTEMNWTEMPKIEVTLFIDCSLPGSSIHCIFQARILDSVAISFYVKSSQPRDWTQVSLIVSRCFTIWATREFPNT